MFCTHCGVKAQASDRFCAGCGRQLRSSAESGPESAPAESAQGETAPQTQQPYSVRNFFLLNVLTLGIYQLYWGWQAWEAVKRLEGRSLHPTVRAIFLPISAFWLFPALDRLAGEEQAHPSRAKQLAAAYLALNIASYFLAENPSPLVYVSVAVAGSLIGALILLPVHAALNEALERKPIPAIKPHYWLAIVLGLILALYALGTYTEAFMPELLEEPPAPAPEPSGPAATDEI